MSRRKSIPSSPAPTRRTAPPTPCSDDSGPAAGWLAPRPALAGAIGDCLRAPAARRPLYAGDHAVAGLPALADDELPAKPAAVLIAVLARSAGATVVLTRRSDRLSNHPGQISLPGGRIDPLDAGPIEAALREAAEEIGLPPAQVNVLGHLPEYRTSTGFAITPVVGFVDSTPVFTPAPHEVDEIFEVPLAFLLDPRNHRRDSRETPGGRRHFFVIPYQDYYIWGATAAMLVSLARLLAPLAGPAVTGTTTWRGDTADA